MPWALPALPTLTVSVPPPAWLKVSTLSSE
jgi:hypothetical protein